MSAFQIILFFCVLKSTSGSLVRVGDHVGPRRACVWRLLHQTECLDLWLVLLTGENSGMSFHYELLNGVWMPSYTQGENRTICMQILVS